MAGAFGGEAAGDVPEVAQFVGGRDKLVRVVVAGADQVGLRGGCRYAANSSHGGVDLSGSFVAPLAMAVGSWEAASR